MKLPECRVQDSPEHTAELCRSRFVIEKWLQTKPPWFRERYLAEMEREASVIAEKYINDLMERGMPSA